MMAWFYDKQIDIMKKAEGYLDDGGIFHNGAETVLKTIDCDVQPYTKERAYKDYGFTIDCTQRVFCDIDIALKAGGTVRYKGELYTIIKLIEWDDYYDIMLNNQ